MTIGQRIKQIRELKNISQKELGEYLNKSQATIAKYENDAAEMDYSTLRAFCNYADCSIDFILNNDSAASIGDPFSDSFGSRLYALRRERNLSQREVSTQIHINPHSLSSYERNKSEPSFYILIKLADYFQCSTDYLLGRVDSPQMITDGPAERIEEPELSLQEIRELRKLLRSHKSKPD